MKRLWVAAALAPLTFAAAHAATTISANTSTPQTTAADGDITINSGVTINPTAGPAAVTINSSNSVSNAGTISYSGVDNATGILANGGNTGSITNTGTITVNENTTGDGTNENVANGPFANGQNRFGIRVVGPGAFNGSIANSGSITVMGENSAGISVETDLTGGINTSGAIVVTGGNVGTADVSYGLHTEGKIGTVAAPADVVISGAITATGQNATGVALDQGVTGKLEILNAITTTGYRSTTGTTDPAVLSLLTPDQLLQGGSVLTIGGNVGAGIQLDAAVAAVGTTAAVPAGVLSVLGSAPALFIGSNSNPIHIGAGSNSFGLTIAGSVSGSGIYPGIDANGIKLGAGLAPVTIDGGINIAGSVTADSVSRTTGQGNAVGLQFLTGASTPTITISGGLSASASATGAVTATALRIDQGASVGSLTNSGVIIAAIGGVPAVGATAAAGGTLGTATAVLDSSGSLTSVTNTNLISASVTPIASTGVLDPTARAIALDLSHGSGAVTVIQQANSASTAAAPITPAITGDVLFGSGPATLNLQAGTLTGSTAFGSNINNSLIIDNGAQMKGGLTVASGGSLDVNVVNGQLYMTNAANLPVSNLNLGASGALIFSVDPVHNLTGEFTVANSATLASGAKVGLNFLSKLNPVGVSHFTVIQAGALTSGQLDNALLGQLPFLYIANLDLNFKPNALTIDVSRQTAAQLGLNPAETAAYEPIYNAFSTDPAVIADLLSKTGRPAFIHLYDQFLPDYAGGPFESLAVGQAALAQAEADAPLKLQTDEVRGWVQEIGYINNRDTSPAANGYQGAGFGMAAGRERARGDSAVGVAVAFLSTGTADSTQSSDANLSASAVEAGVYWRAGGEGLNAHASVNGGWAFFDSRRLLVDETQTTTTTAASTNATTGVTTPASTNIVDNVALWREAKSRWNGAVVSAQVGVSYQMTFGRLYLRPEVAADYILLYESAHTESGGGSAVDLAIGSRVNHQGSVQADLVMGANLGVAIRWRPELTLGWRGVVTGGPADTTATFVSGGNSFTLSPQFADKGGLLARLGVRAGGAYADFAADAGGEFRSGYQTYDARAVARFLF